MPQEMGGGRVQRGVGEPNCVHADDMADIGGRIAVAAGEVAGELLSFAPLLPPARLHTEVPERLWYVELGSNLLERGDCALHRMMKVRS